MAGIGDYVHARKINYLSKSIYRYGDRTPPSAQEIYKTQKEKIKEEAMRQKFKNPVRDKQKIEKWLNMFFHPGMRKNIKGGELSQQNVENIQKAIELYINKHFNGSFTLNQNNLSVGASDVFDVSKASAELMAAVNKFSSLQSATRRNVKGLIDRIKALKALRDQLGQQNFKNQKIWNELQNLDNDLRQLEKDVERYKQISGNTGATIVTRWLSKDQNNERLDDKINRLISSLKTDVSSVIIGEYGEVVLKATNYVANKKGNATVSQILKYLDNSLKNISKSNKGVSGSAISYYANFYKDESALYDKNGKEIDYNTLQGDQFTINMTEDKVDAIIDIDKDLNNLNLSIKNYDLSNNNSLTLLSGRNLLGLVQDYPIFINHFLNIVGTHVDDNFNNNEIDYMHSAMKISAFIKAIAGGVVTKQGRNVAADLFIVNDNSQQKGYYKVYFLSDILDKVINNIKLISIDNYPDGIWEANKWIEPQTHDWIKAATRITAMVNVMRTMNLHITISKKALE